jgi:hypothetical protein
MVQDVVTPFVVVAFAVQASSAFFLVSLIVVEAEIVTPAEVEEHSQVYSFLQEANVKTPKAAIAINFFIVKIFN